MITISNFQYDDIPSQRFGLIIGSIGDGGVENINTYTNMEVFTDRPMNRAAPFYYGTRLADHLKFPMTVINKHGKFYESWEVQIIQNWLFGRSKPEILTIFDPDKMNEGFECWLLDPQVIKVDNKVLGFSFLVRCTSAYAITDIKKTVINNPTGSTTFNYWNHSSIEAYLYPEDMTIQLASDTSFVRIENLDDNGYIFQLTGLRNGETIYVNNDLGSITTKSGNKVLNKLYNYNYFRVVEGINRLSISGKCTITLKTRFMRGVGGY